MFLRAYVIASNLLFAFLEWIADGIYRLAVRAEDRKKARR